MRLSLHTDYALRVLIYLAEANSRAKVAEIAGYFDISRDHVAKVTQRLARLGYIRAIRGAGGGLELAMDPGKVRLGPIIADFEGTLHLLECVGAIELPAQAGVGQGTEGAKRLSGWRLPKRRRSGGSFSG